MFDLSDMHPRVRHLVRTLDGRPISCRTLELLGLWKLSWCCALCHAEKERHCTIMIHDGNTERGQVCIPAWNMLQKGKRTPGG